MAEWYANQHLATDPGIDLVYYLPTDAGEREIRLVEVNNFLDDQTDDALEPIDFGVDFGIETAHLLVVLDVTLEQRNRISNGMLSLPAGWTFDGNVRYSK